MVGNKRSRGECRRGAAAGEEIYKRLAVFGEHLAKLEKSLGGSVESFNRAVGSLEQQVLPPRAVSRAWGCA